MGAFLIVWNGMRGMSSSRIEPPTPALRVIPSMSRGFETVAEKLVLVLPPLLLDLFLWLGPRLSVAGVAEGLVQSWTAMLRSADPEVVLTMRQDMDEFFSHLNVFSALSTAPLGVPSLMGATAPDALPDSISPGVWVLDSAWEWFGATLLLWVLGLGLGALYFGMIAHQVRDGRLRLRALLAELPGYWGGMVGLALSGALAVFAITLPFACISGVLGTFGLSLGILALMAGIGIGMWSLIFLIFTVHAMMLNGRGLLDAMRESINIVKLNTPATFSLIFLAVVINQGLSYLWGLPEPDSWVRLVGLAGHAFISTGVIASTFVFYQDRYRYWREFNEYLIEYLRRERGETA